jgi:GMP reductase
MLTNKKALGFRDVLIQPQSSDIKSRKEVSLERTFKFNNGLEKTFTPIIAANMYGIGTFRVASILSRYKMLTCITKDVNIFDYEELLSKYPKVYPYIVPTFGLYKNLQLVHFFNEFPGIDFICLDVANGYMSSFIEWVKTVRSSYPDKVIIAGNVATFQGAADLYLAGADIVKVGIGSGSVCTTRYKTGVGIPQVTAITDCAHTMGLTCSDGGCTSPGDIAKAFVAGADFVMIGGMLAGTNETGSVYQGSAFTEDTTYRVSEGKRVNFSEPIQSLDERIREILGGLRSTGSYIGQKRIEDFWKADLIQTNEQTNDYFGPPS